MLEWDHILLTNLFSLGTQYSIIKIHKYILCCCIVMIIIYKGVQKTNNKQKKNNILYCDFLKIKIKKIKIMNFNYHNSFQHSFSG